MAQDGEQDLEAAEDGRWEEVAADADVEGAWWVLRVSLF